MARKVVWTSTALKDLELVAEFISRDSEYYAAALVREVCDAARSLSPFALRGRMVPEFEDKSIPSRVAVLAFVHGARDLRNLWLKRFKR